MTGTALKVAIRADSSMRIGTGHAMRCLALANSVRRGGGRTRFVSGQMIDPVRESIMREGHEFVALEGARPANASGDTGYSSWLGTTEEADAEATLRSLDGETWDLLVVDHYALGARWEGSLRKAARQILVIDDLADRAHDCDLLLDQNVSSLGNASPVPERCRKLFGPRYALLREEFSRLHEQAVVRTGVVQRVLIFMGGTDPANHTSRAIEALADTRRTDLEVDVVIGRAHPQVNRVQEDCASRGYRFHLQAMNFVQLVAQADFAIGSGGSAAWERCCLGVPALTVCIADNQKRLIDHASRNGLLYAAGTGETATLTHHLHALFDSPGLLNSISANGLRNVDGHGVRRVLRAVGGGTIEMRGATHEDSANILAWRNHGSVRMHSRNCSVIDEATHNAWLGEVLADGNRPLLIGERDGMPVGVVRFDIADSQASVSIFLAPGLAGRGLGGQLLAAAERWLFESRGDVKSIFAEVLGDNPASEGLFEAGGYHRHATTYVKRLDQK